MRVVQRLLLVVPAVVLVACGTANPYGANNYPVANPQPVGSYPAGNYPSQPVAYVEYGRISSVELISGRHPQAAVRRAPSSVASLAACSATRWGRAAGAQPPPCWVCSAAP